LRSETVTARWWRRASSDSNLFSCEWHPISQLSLTDYVYAVTLEELYQGIEIYEVHLLFYNPDKNLHEQGGSGLMVCEGPHCRDGTYLYY
jgi:hypothetical protein